MSELVRDWKAEKKDLEEAFDIIADKLVKADAEIERLNSEVNRLTQDLVCYRADVVNRDAEITRLNTVIGILEAAAKRDVSLITELCDALEIHSSTYPGAPIEKLIQKGRKATRAIMPAVFTF